MNILLMATFSYAGMGPYVCKIFNEFSHDNIYGFFIDDQQHYYRKNLRPSHPENIKIVQGQNAAEATTEISSINAQKLK